MTPIRSRASRSRCSCAPTSTTRRRASSASTSSAGGCSHRPGCCAPAALTVDPFLLSGASLGAAWRAERGGAAGAVYHAAGRLDPARDRAAARRHAARPRAVGAARGVPARPAARFGQRLRGRLLRDAAAVIVGTEARRRPPGGCSGSGATGSRWSRSRRGRRSFRAWRRRRSPGGRRGATDGRADPRRARAPRAAGALPRLLGPLRRPPGPRDAAPRARGSSPTPAGPPGSPRTRRGRRGCSSPAPRPDDRAALARAAAREGVGEALAYAPRLPTSGWPALVRGARAAILPVVSDAAGPAGDRGDRLRRAGRRLDGRRPARDRRRGGDPRRAARPGPARVGRSRPSGPTTASTSAGRGRPRPGAERAPDVGGRGRRDAGRLRRGRRAPR